jgi:hypothetical protein
MKMDHLGTWTKFYYRSKLKPNAGYTPRSLKYMINGNITYKFEASCNDSKKLQETWRYKTTKIISRTRRVRP